MVELDAVAHCPRRIIAARNHILRRHGLGRHLEDARGKGRLTTAVHLDGRQIGFLDGRQILLAIAPIADHVVAAEVLLRQLDDVLLPDLRHAVESATGIVPVLESEKRPAQHTDTGSVALQLPFVGLFEIGDDGGDQPLLEAAALENLELLEQQRLHLLQGLALLGDAVEILGTQIIGVVV